MLLLSTALALSSFLSPFKSLAPHTGSKKPDERVSFTLHNDSHNFHDVMVGGTTYTILEKQSLDIKAPVGTVVYAKSPFGVHHRGDVLLTVNSLLESTHVEME